MNRFLILLLALVLFSCGADVTNISDDDNVSSDTANISDDDNVSSDNANVSDYNNTSLDIENIPDDDNISSDTANISDDEDIYSNDIDNSVVCGNDLIEFGEICDGTVKECKDIDSSLYISGDATCDSSCTDFDKSNYILKPVCGNNKKEGSEFCDGNQVDCSSLDSKFTSGKAFCNDNCEAYDLLQCQQKISMKVTVDTKTYNGNYAPKNVFAIWIENESGDYIRTLLVKAKRYKKKLDRWASISNMGSTGMVDAVTSASRNNHNSESVLWDLKDKNDQKVSDGIYKVWFEVNETNGTSKKTSATIRIDNNPKVTEIKNSSNIKNIEITFE